MNIVLLFIFFIRTFSREETVMCYRAPFNDFFYLLFYKVTTTNNFSPLFTRHLKFWRWFSYTLFFNWSIPFMPSVWIFMAFLVLSSPADALWFQLWNSKRLRRSRNMLHLFALVSFFPFQYFMWYGFVFTYLKNHVLKITTVD